MEQEQQEPEPWEQQKGEQSKTFFNFTVFRDLGPYRTIEKIIPAIERIVRECQDDSEMGPEDAPRIPSLSALTKASARWGWVKRCEAWDNHLDEVARTEQEIKVKEMAKRHADDSERFQQEANDLLDEMKFIDKATSRAWHLNTVVNTYNAAATLERLSRGEPPEEEANQKSGLKELGELFSTHFPEDDEEEGPDSEEAEKERVSVEAHPEEREELYQEEHGSN